MLDVSIGVGMTLGVPRVSADTLCDLHRLLLSTRISAKPLRNASFVLAQEKQDERAAPEVQERLIATDSARTDQPGTRVDRTLRPDERGADEGHHPAVATADGGG